MAEIRVNATGAVKLFDNDDSHFVGLQAGSVSSNVTFTLPTADGSDGQVLTTDGSGALSFATASSANPPSADGDSIGTASLEWSDLFLADGGIIKFGNDQDVLLTHVADTGLLLSGTNVIQFNDASQNIGAPSATVLDINATDEIELNATLLDVNANLDVSGTTLLPTLGVITAKDLGVGIHIRTADSGASVASDMDELVLENSTNTGLTILSATDGLGRIAFGDSGDNAVGTIDYNHDGNLMKFGTSGALGLQIDGNGHVTKPKQPAVLYSGNNENNFTGDGTNLRIGIDSGVGTTEVFDVNADQTTGTFTAPVTGKYLIAGQMWIEGIESNHDNLTITMATSNRSYFVALDIHELGRASANSLGLPFCAFADMDANDTHILSVSVSGGSKVIDLVDLTKIGITLLS